jgi:hypothetical protein
LGLCGSFVGLLVNFGFFLGRLLALTSTQCNCVVPFRVFLIYTFLLIRKKKKKKSKTALGSETEASHRCQQIPALRKAKKGEPRQKKKAPDQYSEAPYSTQEMGRGPKLDQRCDLHPKLIRVPKRVLDPNPNQ